MLVKRYFYEYRPMPDGKGTRLVERVGWYLFGLIPLYVGDA